MMPQWIIERKRDGHKLSEDEIRFFISGYAKGTIPDYQMSALAMAVYFRGMALDEVLELTRAMLNSGRSVNTASITAPKIDKHSTGGIGDKISLVLAPMVACCGVAVPMISGRGLGITGGTLDKLESIPGYRTRLTEREFIKVLRSCGCSLIGQTAQIVPADRKLYALRDVTATVPSIPLIVSSILSKKLAEGIDGLVLDVKCGSGAFMRNRKDAQALARMLVKVGARLGLKTAAIITDMNQPLGRNVGNTLEVIEAVKTLQGRGPVDVLAVTMELGILMLLLAGITANRETARKMLMDKIRSGEAFERFKLMVRLHGGDPRVIDNLSLLSKSTLQEPVCASRSGFLRAVDAGKIGKVCLMLGGGRAKIDDSVDHAVGISDLKKTGEPVKKGEPLAVIHANKNENLEVARLLMSEAFQYSSKHVRPAPLIFRVK